MGRSRPISMAAKRKVGSRKKSAETAIVGTVRSTCQKEGRHFATMELVRTGTVQLRLVNAHSMVGNG
jgi:hypothetical protein